jgi:hypothetical protein
MPQHAVTKGYEKSEYLRAQASALSRVVVRKPDWSGVENISFVSLVSFGLGAPSKQPWDGLVMALFASVPYYGIHCQPTP